MAVTVPKITVKHSLTWTPASGDSINFNGQESFTQTIPVAGMETVTVTTTTAALPLFGVTGLKYFGVRNTDLVANIYVDVVTPVIPSGASVKTLSPGKSMLIPTTQNTWYGISDTGAPQAVVVAAAAQ